jgi:hypothetical protein
VCVHSREAQKAGERMSDIIKCAVPECLEQFPYDRAQPNRRYCCDNCRSLATQRRRRERARIKKQLGIEPRRPPIDLPPPVPRRLDDPKNGYGSGVLQRDTDPAPIRGGILDVHIPPTGEEECCHEPEDEKLGLLTALIHMGEPCDISIRPGDKTGEIRVEMLIKPRT